MSTSTAIFPGSFDPITNGHLDIIKRAGDVFSKVVVAVGQNPEKVDVFTPEERVEMISELVSEMSHVSVASYSGLTIDFARQAGATVIVRGIRDSSDLRDELQAANTNLIVGGIETVFLMASEQFALTSSTFIKQIVSMGGKESARLSTLVPDSILKKLQSKFAGP